MGTFCLDSGGVLAGCGKWAAMGVDIRSVVCDDLVRAANCADLLGFSRVEGSGEENTLLTNERQI